MNILLSCSIILALNAALNVADKRRCGTMKDQSPVCCSGYINIENRCTECIGSYGKDCSKECPHGFYGVSCKEECKCKETETCDPFAGCVDINVKCSWNASELRNRLESRITSRSPSFSGKTSSVSEHNNKIERKNITISKSQGERKNITEECQFVFHAVIGIIAFQLLILIFVLILFMYRHRRQGKYEVQNIMAKSVDSTNQVQELQLIRYEEIEENINCIPKSISEITYHKVHHNQRTYDYSRVYFPKIKTVDTPADQYSRTVINKQNTYERKSNISCSTDQDKVHMRREVRLSSIDQFNLRGPRPYSFARTTWNL